MSSRTDNVAPSTQSHFLSVAYWAAIGLRLILRQHQDTVQHSTPSPQGAPRGRGCPVGALHLLQGEQTPNLPSAMGMFEGQPSSSCCAQHSNIQGQRDKGKAVLSVSCGQPILGKVTSLACHSTLFPELSLLRRARGYFLKMCIIPLPQIFEPFLHPLNLKHEQNLQPNHPEGLGSYEIFPL